MFNKYPYTDFHELNLDWFLNQFKELVSDWDTFKTDLTGQWEQVSTDWETLYNYVHDYFDNLDVQAEIDHKLDEMAADGSLLAVIQNTVVNATGDWLANNITQPTTPVVDTSLSVSGAAADAKVTGDKINLLQLDLDYIRTPFNVNLFDVDTLKHDIFLDSATGAETPSVLYNASDFIAVDPSTSYTIRTFETTGSTYYRVYFYDSSRNFISRDMRDTSVAPYYFIFATPANCAYIRLNFENSTNIQNAETCAIIKGAIALTEYVPYYTAFDRYARANGIINLGVLPDLTDLDTLTGNHVYVLTSENTYSNSPYTAGILWTVEAGTVKAQYISQFTTGVTLYRRQLANAWNSWTDGDDFNITSYGAMFGDSLAYGAVYPVNQPMYRAEQINRIPDRIGYGIGTSSMINYAEGGSGFVSTQYYPTTIGEKIKSADLSLYDIIIISGGRNDSNAQLGTSAAVANDGTICGAVKDILNYIRTNYPTIQVVWVQTTPNTYFGDVFTGVTTGGWSLNSMETEIGAICNTYNVPYITWKDWTPITDWENMCGDGTQHAHPASEDVYKKMGLYLAGKVGQYWHS